MAYLENTEVHGDLTVSGNINYDNTTSGLTATNVQGAIDEVNSSSTWKTWKSGVAINSSTYVQMPTDWVEAFVDVTIADESNIFYQFHIFKNKHAYFINGYGIPSQWCYCELRFANNALTADVMYNGATQYGCNCYVYYR